MSAGSAARNDGSAGNHGSHGSAGNDGSHGSAGNDGSDDSAGNDGSHGSAVGGGDARSGLAGLVVTPEPSDEELTAILAAYEQLWPEPAEAQPPASAPRWRYAGRWWTPRPRYGGWA